MDCKWESVWTQSTKGGATVAPHHHSQWPTGGHFASFSYSSDLGESKVLIPQRSIFFLRGQERSYLTINYSYCMSIWTSCIQKPAGNKRSHHLRGGNRARTAEGSKATLPQGDHWGASFIPSTHDNHEWTWLAMMAWEDIDCQAIRFFWNKGLGHTTG